MKKIIFSVLLAFLGGGFPIFASNASTGFLDFLLTEERISKDSRLEYGSDQKIVDFLHSIGMTKYSKLSDFMPNKTITRAEASKFFVKFTENAGFLKKIEKSDSDCIFSDISAYQKQDLHASMISSCEYGLFKGSEGKFNPEGNLTFGEALAVTLRMLDGKKLDETGTHRALNYVKQAQNYRLILTQLQNISENNLEPLGNAITRLDLGRLLE